MSVYLRNKPGGIRERGKRWLFERGILGGQVHFKLLLECSSAAQEVHRMVGGS